MEYQNPTGKAKPYNQYQVKKLLTLFNKLQANSLIKIFQDSSFQSVVISPEVTFEKSKPNAWMSHLWIAEELFCHVSSFMLTNL